MEELFAQFRHRLWIVFALTLCLGILLAGISMNRILNLEHEMRERYSEIAQARGELQSCRRESSKHKSRSGARFRGNYTMKSASRYRLCCWPSANLGKTPPLESDQRLQELIQSIRLLVKEAWQWSGNVATVAAFHAGRLGVDTRASSGRPGKHRVTAA